MPRSEQGNLGHYGHCQWLYVLCDPFSEGTPVTKWFKDAHEFCGRAGISMNQRGCFPGPLLFLAPFFVLFGDPVDGCNPDPQLCNQGDN